MMMDPEFRRLIIGDYMESALHYCLQCSRCTQVCPVYEASDEEYNPRSIILASYLGFKDKLIDVENPLEIWACQICDTCDIKCPQDIPLTEIFYIVKNLSLQAGQAPEFYVTQTKTVLEHGKAIPIQAAIEKRRERMGLPPVPSGFVDEVKIILKETKLEEKLSKY